MNRFEMVMAELRRVWPMDAKVISDHIAARDATITQLRAELERVKGRCEVMEAALRSIDAHGYTVMTDYDMMQNALGFGRSVVDGAGGGDAS